MRRTYPEREGHRRRLDDERGAVAVLFALTIVILFAAVAFVVDISRLYHERQVLQNAVDFGALAGAQDLPVQGSSQATVTSQMAQTVAIANAPQITPSSLTIVYQCIVADDNGDGQPNPGDVPFVCGPSSGTWTSGWTPKPGRVVHACDPFAGDKCNTIRLTTSNTIPYFFAPVIGINTGSTGAVNAASCRGSCGAATSPLDVVMVLDRTGSMTPSDIANVKNAALSILSFYDSSKQWVGLVALPYGQPSNKCAVNDPQMYPDSNYADWQVSPLSQDYTRADGTLNTSSQIVQSINCLQRTTGNPRVFINGVDMTNGNHTNFGDPLNAARTMLAQQGRPTVPDVIIFETDGQANQPSTMQPCNYFNTRATTTKSAGQTIITIAYGIRGVRCTDYNGPFYNVFATTNLAMAATSSTDDVPGGCGPNENKDGDLYFCTPGSNDLEPVFRQAAAAALQTTRLVE